MQEGLRKNGNTEVLKEIVFPRADLSIRRQCELLGVNRNKVYYKEVKDQSEDLELMHKMDREYLEHPTKGVLGMIDFLQALGTLVGSKRVRRFLRKMGIMTIYPRRNLSKLGASRYIRSYKLRGLEFTHSNQVWCIDIKYIPMSKGFLYLTAIIDAYSRDIVGWDISNTLDAESSLKVPRKAITEHGKPEIINSDKGSQLPVPDGSNIWKKRKSPSVWMEETGLLIIFR